MNNIILWWKHVGQYLHMDFYNGVKNLIKWFPVIWKDRQWDDSYILEVLKTKIKFQADYIGKRGVHLDANIDAQRMMTCISLINKVQSEFYQSEYSDYNHCEFSFIRIEDNPEYSRMESREIWEKYDDYFAKYPHAYREVTKTDKYIFENDSKQKIAMNMGYYLDKKANRLLFKMLETHLRSWWD